MVFFLGTINMNVYQYVGGFCLVLTKKNKHRGKECQF